MYNGAMTPRAELPQGTCPHIITSCHRIQDSSKNPGGGGPGAAGAEASSYSVPMSAKPTHESLDLGGRIIQTHLSRRFYLPAATAPSATRRSISLA